MIGLTLLQTACLLLGGPLDEAAVAEPFVVRECLVAVKEEAQIPARQAGVVTVLAVREGSSVMQGGMIARLDRTQAQRQLLVAMRQEQAARKAAEDDIDIRYAAAAAKVAEAEHAAALAVNRRVANTVPQSEVRRLQLEKVRADLQIEQSQHEKELEAYTLRLKEAEVRLAEVDLLRCDIKSPLDGMVVRTLLHAGEWVNPGDPICAVMRVDKLLVEGFINAEALRTEQVLGQTVQIRLPGAKQPLSGVTGRVGFVSPEVDASGECRFWAEVNNRQEQGQWVLRPGTQVELLILRNAAATPNSEE